MFPAIPAGVHPLLLAPAAAPHRPARRLIAPGLAIVGAVLAPGRANACGASEQPTFAIGAVSPAPGSSAVARDAGIIVSGVPSLPSPGPFIFANIELLDAASGEPVPLQPISWFSHVGTEETLALHPLAPLAPQHGYRVEATPIDPSSGEAGGPPVVSSFVTSDALLEPLALSGELGLALRGGEVDVVECGACGYDCAATGTRRALLANVQLPAPSGGQGVYRGLLHFSDHTPTRVGVRDPAEYETSAAEPHEVHVMQGVTIEAGEALTLQQEVFEEGFAYAGCFTFVVWDPAGHVAQTSACLPSLTPDEVRALADGEEPLELATDEEEATAQIQLAAAADRGDRAVGVGCALGASGPTNPPAWLALLLSSALLRRFSRRR